MTTKSRSERLHLSRWAPIAAMILLMVVLGAYTNSRNPAFLSSFTLNNLLVATMPLALAAMGQTSALMVRAFDVSVGALTTLCLVVASFVLTPDSGWAKLIFGMAIVLLVAMAVACFNVLLIRVLKLSSIIATLATYSILFGISLRLRHQPGGHISDRFTSGLLTKVGFLPVAFVLIVIVAVAADFWLYRSAGGLAARATGLDEESAKRRGVRVGFLFVRAFFIVAAAAAFSSYFMATNAQIGDPNYGIPYTLTSISAAVLGGASLLGGRGSFLGAVVGALFVNMITTVLPFLGWSNSRGQIAIGVLTLLALSFYQAPELMARIRAGISNFKLARGSTTTAVDAGVVAAMDAVQRLLAYHEIADVIGRYCMLFDDQDWDDLAELWTADASFEVEGKIFAPREVLLDFLSTCLPVGFQSKHMIAPPLIDLDDDGLAAHTRTDVVWISGNFDNTIVARYHDDLVKQDGRWRFRRRLEIPMQYTPGPPPMSETATGVSAATMRADTS